jgi:hypothetical protein
MTIWICVDASKQVGDNDHLKGFANEDATEKWFPENDAAHSRRHAEWEAIRRIIDLGLKAKQ